MKNRGVSLHRIYITLFAWHLWNPPLKDKWLNFLTSLDIIWRIEVFLSFFSSFWKTISCHYHNVLNAIMMSEAKFLIQPSAIMLSTTINFTHILQ